jgi:hypothetical protein
VNVLYVLVVLLCICGEQKHNKICYELRFTITVAEKQNERNPNLFHVFLTIHFCFPLSFHPFVSRKRRNPVNSKPYICNNRIPSLHCSHNKQANLRHRSLGHIFLCGQKIRKSNSNGTKLTQITKPTTVK